MSKRFVYGILTLALFFRVVALSSYPFGFTPDEASFGYDAYSLIKTGKDQWGQSFPLVLKSFGDFKSPLLAYLSMPFVWIFGLTKSATRLPNALIGTAAVYATYLFVKKMFEQKKISFGNLRIEDIVLLLMAISPWHIMMSRGAFEANLTTLFMPLGMYFFLKGFSDIKSMNISAILFGLNLFTYHSAKLVTPLVLLLAIFLFRDKLSFKKYFVSFGIFLVFVLLTVYTFTLGAGARVADVSIFSGALVDAARVRIPLIEGGMNPIWARLLHNKYETIVVRFLNNYFDYFSFKFLFASGPAEGTYGMIPGRGVLFFAELPLLLGAIFYYWKKKFTRMELLVLFWLLIAPVPAALTVGRGYAANRATTMLPVLYIFLGLGAHFWQGKIKNKEKLALNMFSVILAISFIGFVVEYVKPSTLREQQMLSGRLEVAQWLAESLTDRPILVSRNLSEPQIYIAFANSWDPRDYQENSKSWDY